MLDVVCVIGKRVKGRGSICHRVSSFMFGLHPGGHDTQLIREVTKNDVIVIYAPADAAHSDEDRCFRANRDETREERVRKEHTRSRMSPQSSTNICLVKHRHTHTLPPEPGCLPINTEHEDYSSQRCWKSQYSTFNIWEINDSQHWQLCSSDTLFLTKIPLTGALRTTYIKSTHTHAHMHTISIFDTVPRLLLNFQIQHRQISNISKQLNLKQEG